MSTTKLQSSLRFAGLLACAIALSACGSTATGGDDNADVTLLDTSNADSGFDTNDDDVQPADTGGMDTTPSDVGPEDVDPDDVRPDDVDPGDTEPDVVPGDVEPTDVEPTDIGPDDVGPDDVDPTDVSPDVDPVDTGPDVDPTDVSPDVDPVDTGPDATIICDSNTSSCDGDTLVRCSPDGTEETRERCQPQDAFCGREGGVASCIDWFCEPESTRCDGDSLYTCDSRGFDELVTRCENGCDAATGQCAGPPVPDCDDPDVTELEEGELVFNLCDAGDEYDNVASNVDCGDYDSRGEDRIFSITLTERSRVQLQLVDFDGSAAIDTILYIRTDCEDAESQIICGDDTDCAAADNMSGCFGGGDGSAFQPRESNIDVELEAGTYYVVADQFNVNYGNVAFGCGTVRLTYELD